jgi:hypothetical protein
MKPSYKHTKRNFAKTLSHIQLQYAEETPVDLLLQWHKFI